MYENKFWFIEMNVFLPSQDCVVVNKMWSVCVVLFFSLFTRAILVLVSVTEPWLLSRINSGGRAEKRRNFAYKKPLENSEWKKNTAYNCTAYMLDCKNALYKASEHSFNKTK